MRTNQSWLKTIGIILTTAVLAQAHSSQGMADGYISGFLHPIFGLDHVVAMVAVGLWGAILGNPAIWLLPVVFPLVMAFGGVLGVAGVPLPGVEIGIALSAIVLGIMVAMALRPPLFVAAIIVGMFAIFHGHAHGAELPKAANALAYSMGFVMSTGMLHLSGVAFGLLDRFAQGKLAIRILGGVISLIGLAFLTHVL